MRLQGKTAIVTGGGSGFGAGIAREFVAQGAQVLLADRNLEAALDVAAALGAIRAPALTLRVAGTGCFDRRGRGRRFGAQRTGAIGIDGAPLRIGAFVHGRPGLGNGSDQRQSHEKVMGKMHGYGAGMPTKAKKPLLAQALGSRTALPCAHQCSHRRDRF